MKNVLDELNKGTTMGIDAINFTLEKVKDENLKNVLTRLKKMYQDVSNKINRMYDGKPHETNILNKAIHQSQNPKKQNLYPYFLNNNDNTEF